MALSLTRIFSGISPKLLRILTLRFDKSPVETLDSLIEFVHTRSAYVAQTSLYGYLKTRMGIRYPSMFSDPVFSESISIAKWHIFAACLSDLATFAAALAAERGGLVEKEAAALARSIHDGAVRATFDECSVEGLGANAEKAFAVRAKATDWAAAARGDNAFARSADQLVEWAPIADELKQFDREIVSNSIRYRWRDVRDQLRKRLAGEALCANWRRGDSGA